MAERKSSRARKAVKYAGLDDESDDDFAEAKPSKTKKQKTVEDDNKSRVKQKISDNNVENLFPSEEPNSIKKRKSLTDRLYENELKEALQLSMLEAETPGTGNDDETSHDTSSTSTPTLANNVQVEVEVEYSKAPDLISAKDEDLPSKGDKSSSLDEEPPPLLPINPCGIGTFMDDKIECVANKIEVEPTPRHRQQRKATKRTIIIDDENEVSGDESDFNPGNANNDSSDENDDDEEGDEENFSPDDDDSDFDDKKKRSKKTKNEKRKSPKKGNKKEQAKEAKSTKKSAASNSAKDVKGTVRTANSRKPQASLSSGNKASPVLKSSPILSSPTPSVLKATTAMTPKLKTSVSSPVVSSKKATEKLSQSWRAPGPASGTNTASASIMKSPSSGLRLGLSRNQRVKPLHSSAKVS